MSKASGYSLWLVPDTNSVLYRIIERYITQVAMEYKTPKFVPHVTLLGGLIGDEKDLCSKTKKLAEMLEPYEVQLGEIGSNGIYFQALLSKVSQANAVISANTLAQQVFGVNNGSYFPHASLAYGDFSQEEIAMLQGDLTKRDLLGTEKNFLVKEVELWRTEGMVRDWYKVAVFPFKS